MAASSVATRPGMHAVHPLFVKRPSQKIRMVGLSIPPPKKYIRRGRIPLWGSRGAIAHPQPKGSSGALAHPLHQPIPTPGWSQTSTTTPTPMKLRNE